MSFAVTASVVGITAGVNSLTGGAITNALGMGGGSKSGGNNVAGVANQEPGQSTQADPYGQYRPADAALLQRYYNDPSMINSDPGFQAQQNMGMQATQRGLAATGQSQSGNEQIALNNYGQSSFNSYRQQMITNLMGSSGAITNPAGGVQATTGQNQLQAGQFNNGINNVAAGVGGLKGLFAGAGGNTGGYGSGYGTQSTSVSGSYLGGGSDTTYGLDNIDSGIFW
jgi:hypothetical protein